MLQGVQTPSGPFSVPVSMVFHSTRITDARELLCQVFTPLCTDPARLHFHVLPLRFLWLSDSALLVFFRAVNPLTVGHNQRPV